jgi:hypothetical protein
VSPLPGIVDKVFEDVKRMRKMFIYHSCGMNSSRYGRQFFEEEEEEEEEEAARGHQSDLRRWRS